MNKFIFENIYKDINIPVIVCEDGDEMMVSFANREAYLLLNPSIILEKPDDADSSLHIPLRQLMRFQNEGDQDNIRKTLGHAGSLSQYSLKLMSPEAGVIPVKIAANTANLGESKYIIIYIYYDESDCDSTNEYNDILAYVYILPLHGYKSGCADDPFPSG